MILKPKGRRFDATEEIQAESQRVLYTLTANYFQEAFKKLEETVGTVSTCGRELLRE
jgi:predicted helicase